MFHSASVEMVKKVLCGCGGNISRSPMMQAVPQQHLGAAFLVNGNSECLQLAVR
jgi:protein-tyrosine-phosphatase